MITPDKDARDRAHMRDLQVGLPARRAAVELLDAMLQKTVPEQYRGRVFSARDALMNGGFLISSVLVGLAAENLNKADTLTVVGLVVILAVVFIRHFSLARESVC